MFSGEVKSVPGTVLASILDFWWRVCVEGIFLGISRHTFQLTFVLKNERFPWILDI